MFLGEYLIMSSLHLPLTDTTGLLSTGQHRFLTIAGRTGLNVRSIESPATFRSVIPRAPQGTLSLWVNSLEDLGVHPEMAHIQGKDPYAFFYPLISDAAPARDVESGYFGVFWNAGWYPKLMAKFCYGRLFPPMDFVMLPWIYADALPLRRGSWYHIVLTWDRTAKRLRLYVNGLLASHNDLFAHTHDSRELLRLGNPCMVLSDLRLEERVWSPEEVSRQFSSGETPNRPEVVQEVRDCFVPRARPALNLSRGSDWTEALACSFTDESDLQGWIRQGPQYEPLPALRITSEGLLVQTPNELAKDTRTFLWSPVNFEGDQWIEFDFRPESPRGLALLVACANGMQREDFVVDHGLPKTGAMGTIITDRVRNYHWEYFRRVEAMRTDLETQVLVKNPWQHPMAFAVREPLGVGTWHRLRFVKTGSRIHGSIDGQTLFDVNDEPWNGSGPVFDFGRVALRQMYHTTLRYRNFSVHTRPTSGE